MTQSPNLVNDVSGLNPVPVWAIVTPSNTDEVVDAMRRSDGAVSIGGGRFSMGGQVASPMSLHLDMRQMRQVLAFSPSDKTIRVQAGIRWRDIQRFIDPHGLAVKIMQTYANFTVGGALSVNCHGRYMGLGPVILSVRSIRLVLADGTVVDATRNSNAELFFAAIGGYGSVGVIAEAELDLVDNHRVQRLNRKMKAGEYLAHFKAQIRTNRQAVFHNADLYPPEFTRARSVTWVETNEPPTHLQHLHDVDDAYPLHRYFVWAITETPLGKWRREYLIDPLVYRRKIVHWRNYEASYDVAELEPASRERATYVLQEYFCPVERFDDFVPKMAEILQRHRVNMVNVSVRHANADPGSLLAWARGETFAFVLYYKQRTRDNAKNRVAVWTRELIDAAISVGGTYYLPYQPHGTPAQFHAAYPRARELFALKAKVDPHYRFRNVLWDRYYAPTLPPSMKPPAPAAPPHSDFHAVFQDVELHDGFYRFLQTVYRLYPEDRFHTLIKDACERFSSEEDIYRHLQRELPRLRPALADLRLALPSLAKQKAEMLRQTLQLLGGRKRVDGYIEIGTTGRYASVLRKAVKISGRLVIANGKAPGMSAADIVERGRLRKLGEYVDIGDHEPLPESLADAGFDLVSCYIGLHHCPPDGLDAFVQSIARVLRPGGLFILRDHDVRDERMRALVALAHTVFNAGLGEPWEVNASERRHFAPIAHWSGLLGRAGLRDSGTRLAQQHDPSDNLLMAFVKEGAV
jgi:FAD/FMN-containing dehydrogenase/SAM-dependent methyltransferase